MDLWTIDCAFSGCSGHKLAEAHARWLVGYSFTGTWSWTWITPQLERRTKQGNQGRIKRKRRPSNPTTMTKVRLPQARRDHEEPKLLPPAFGSSSRERFRDSTRSSGNPSILEAAGPVH